MTDTTTAAAVQGAGTEHLNPAEVTAGTGIPKEPTEAAPKVEATPEQTKAQEEAAKVAEAEAAAKKTAEGQAKQDDAEPATEYPELPTDAGQAAVGLLKDAGLTVADAEVLFAKAIETGDLKQVDLKGLIAKIGTEKAAAALALLGQHVETVVNGNKAVVDAVHGVVGGEQNWTKVQAWSQALEVTDPAWAKQVAEYRQLFNSPVTATLATKAILERYNADPKNSGLNNSLTTATGSGAPVAEGGPLDRSEYYKLYSAESAKPRPNPSVLASLNARRAAGMKQGI